MKFVNHQRDELVAIMRALAKATVDMDFLAMLDLRRYEEGAIDDMRKVWIARALTTEALRTVRTILHEPYHVKGVDEAMASLFPETWQSGNKKVLPAKWSA